MLCFKEILIFIIDLSTCTYDCIQSIFELSYFISEIYSYYKLTL